MKIFERGQHNTSVIPIQFDEVFLSGFWFGLILNVPVNSYGQVSSPSLTFFGQAWLSG